ncbi:MAG: hypothetical protein ACOC4F_04535 [bacterium]
MPTNRQLYRRSIRIRRRRRRPCAPATCTIAELLDRQPKTLKRQDAFSRILDSARSSAELRAVRLSKNAFRQLHHAQVAPSEIEAFCRRYALPRHPFFPDFLSAKRDYLAERERIHAARKAYILSRTRQLPGPVVACMKYLGYLENHYNRSGRHPLWQAKLFPSSKKQIHEYERYSTVQWIARFRAHLAELEARYPALSPVVRERTVACFVLEMLPEQTPPPRPAARELTRQYRFLSLQHHPDRGGDSAMFIELKAARDTLLR